MHKPCSGSDRRTEPRWPPLSLPAAVLATLLPLAAAAQMPSAPTVEGARLVQWSGDVQLAGAAGRLQPDRAARLPAGELRTGADGQAQLVMADGTTLAVGPGSQLRWDREAERQLRLDAGSLRIDATRAPRGWRILLPDRSVLTNGYLRLVPCAAGCTLPAGLYGRIAQGEAVLEYQGGRSVLRNRSFHWRSAAVRPEALPQTPALLDDAGSRPAAERTRSQAAGWLREGLEAFRDERFDVAGQRLAMVRDAVPGETLVNYYLGLIALKRGDNPAALDLLQRYAREDPEGAAAREVPKTLTLLASSQLQQEVASAIAREREVVAAEPEPNSIAVHAFVNRGSDAYRALAKGLAAMIIADLDKVPGLKVLEREKVQLLLDEMKLGDAGLADPASAVRSGRLMRAEKVIVGNFEVQ